MSEFSAAVKSTVDASSRNGPVDSWVHHPASKGRHSETVIDITSPESLPRRRLAADEKHRIEFWIHASPLWVECQRDHSSSSFSPSHKISLDSGLFKLHPTFFCRREDVPVFPFNLQPSLLFPRAFLWRPRRQMNLHYLLSRL